MNDTTPLPRDPKQRPTQESLVVKENHGTSHIVEVPPIMGLGTGAGAAGLITGEPVPVGFRKGSGEGASWISGAGVFGDVQSLMTDFEQWEKDPIGAGLKVVATADSASASTPSDVLSVLIDAGLGWMVDHLEPMPTHLDMVAGDPDGMKAVSASWGKIAHEIASLGTDLGGHAKQDLSHLSSRALTSYDWVLTSKVAAIGALSKVCEAAAKMASALADAATSLRNIVRGIYIEVCKAIVKFVLYRAGFFKPNLISEVKGLVINGAKIVNEYFTNFRPRMQQAQQLLGSLSTQAGTISNYLAREATT